MKSIVTAGWDRLQSHTICLQTWVDAWHNAVNSLILSYEMQAVMQMGAECAGDQAKRHSSELAHLIVVYLSSTL